MATEKIKMRLQGHEKFPLRDGWLNKGLREVNQNEEAFIKKDAPDSFGIGSNMVKSLRYWMRALGLVDEKSGKAYLSQLGQLVLDYDPYLEDPFSLWTMHICIANNIGEATSWYMYFNRCDAEELEKDQIVSILHREVIKYAQGQSFSDKSLMNDVDVLLSMYSKDKENDDPEDKNISPFAQLGLIRYRNGKYCKVRPDKRKIVVEVVLYYLALLLAGRDSMAIDTLINGERGISKILHLSTIDANEFLDRLDSLGYIRVDRTAGIDMIYAINPLEAREVLENYYNNRK